MFAGEPVEVVVTGGLVEILHAGVLVATHVQRRRPDHTGVDEHGVERRLVTQRRARRPGVGPSVVRVADANGAVSFAGVMYRAGRAWARRSIEVSLVAGSVQLACDGQVIRVHAARHDPAKEHGAFATPNGRPRKPKPAPKPIMSPTYRTASVARVPELDRGANGVCFSGSWWSERQWGRTQDRQRCRQRLVHLVRRCRASRVA